MKRIKLLTIALFATAALQAQQGVTLDAKIEKKIDKLMAKMSTKEKVGQMLQVTLDVVAKGKPFDDNKEMEIDEEKLRKAVVEYGVGSILNTGTYTLPREKWYELIGRIQEVATKETPNKIPVIYGVDAIHGVNYTVGATLFPQELPTAATWNPQNALNLGNVTAYETRASAIPWNFSPVLDLGRQPLWSRMFETLGEDPYLATVMGSAIVDGYQGTDVADKNKVAACLKHYVGYSYSKSGKDRTPIWMSERELRQYWLEPFRAAIQDHGAWTVMVNSTEINGTPVHADKHILTDILKDELGFKGFAVTDWEDIIMLHTVHKVAATQKEAVKLAINAGIDMSMDPLNLDFCDYLYELVEEGEVPMERIDDAVRRILRVKFELGLFKKTHYPMSDYPNFGSAESAALSYKAAQEAITLLKNNKAVLPLEKSTKVLVTGAASNSLNMLNGAWTHTWQGVEVKYNTKGKKTILEAVQDKVGAENVKHVAGTTYDEEVDIAAAVEAAKASDVVIVCLGEKPSTEVVGNIEDLTFPKAQLDLVEALSAAGKPIIVLLVESRPRIFSSVEPLTDAVLMCYNPGDEGGRAIADVLYGDVNPSGHLPITYPRHTGSITNYDYKFSETRDNKFGNNQINPQYAFGDGLSYTTFKYSNLMLSNTTLTKDGAIKVSIDITNTGTIAGDDVVQLYTRDHYASITPENRRLKGFERVSLAAGETKTVYFTISAAQLAFVNKSLEWVTEPGKFDVWVADQLGTFELK